MPSFNKITIIGHLGRDPETRFTPQGTAVCTFSVATTEKRKDKDDATTWFRVAVFGKSAENAQQYLAKGRLVYVEGRLRQEEFTDRDGNRRASLEVTASDWHVLDKREEQARAASAGAGDDDTIPF